MEKRVLMNMISEVTYKFDEKYSLKNEKSF